VCSRFSSHVIVANDLWRDRLISRSVRPDDCSTFLNYPDPVLFRPFRPKRPNPRFVMIYPGTLSWLQGLDVAIRALPLILAERRDVELRMYGNGPAVDDLRALIQELQLQEHAFILEPHALDAVPEMVIDADLGVVPKRGQGFPGEAFSTKILEFMAVGVPVLVSRTRIDQYYFSPENVRFFEPENVEDFARQVLGFMSDPSERERLRNAGFKLIEEHGWARHRERYCALVAALTDRGRPCRGRS
jgi:glycosyltransferase involved in cell wall biosynthesis